MTNSKLPLDGIRVLDITLVWAGPYATQMLADWGAEVIRLEPIDHFQPMARGQRARVSKGEVNADTDWHTAYPDWDPGPMPWNRTPSFNVHARNKKSMTVNLGAPGGQEVFQKLLHVADVLIENNVPTTADKLGISYERAREINPGFIMVRMPGFGLQGPYRTYRTLGSHIDGVSGHASLRGYPDLGLEFQTDIFYSDAAGGINCALAVMMALRNRQRTGKGQMIELAQVENFTSYISDVNIDRLANGRVHRTLGNRHRTMVPHGCYPCSGDDEWVVIAVEKEEQWDALCGVMGSPSWTADRKFASYLSRYEHQDELDALISEWTRERNKGDLMSMLQEAGVPAGQVSNHREVYEDPQLRGREFFQHVSMPGTGEHEYPSIIGRLSETPNAIRTPPPRLGEHNEYVYKDLLGYTDSEYVALEGMGHIGNEYHPHVE